MITNAWNKILKTHFLHIIHTNKDICTKPAGFLKNFFATLVVAFFVFAGNLYSQNVTAMLRFDASNQDLPIQLLIDRNERADVASIRITAQEPSKFTSYQVNSDMLTIFPISDTQLEISCQADGKTCFTEPNVPIMAFISDNSTYDQSFEIEYLNRNGQAVYAETVGIKIPSDFPLPQPCNQTFLNLNTGGNLSPTQLDPNWKTAGGGPVYAVSQNYPVSDPIANWVNFNTYNGGPWNNDVTFERKICGTANTSGSLSLCVAADNIAKVYWNNVLITQTTNGVYGFMQFTCVTNQVVPVLAGTNVLKVVLTNKLGDMAFIIANASITTPVGNLGLSSDKCCDADTKARIYGRKIWDLNCNGRVDPGDTPQAGWTINLTDPAGATTTTVTDALGNYVFANLNPGNYTVSETMQAGWNPSSSVGPYNLYVGPSGSVMRDFLNCKPPKCEELFVPHEKNDECCNTSFSVSNANSAALQTLTYTVTGGVVNSITVSPCSPITTPVNLNGTTTGTLTFNTACTVANTLNFYVNATATNATGEVCITWSGTFIQNGQTFKCGTTTCIQCERMPKSCNSKLNVVPNVFGPVNTDYRTFTITNLKQPVSKIQSVDLKFINESVPHHIGGGLVVDANNRNWTFSNSGGPADAYTQIRLACTGSNAVHGTAANNTVAFNLGVDNTTVPLYTGTVHFMVIYCDGDTCEFDYQWAPIIKHDNSDYLKTNPGPPNSQVFGLEVTLPEGAQSFSVTLNDPLAKLIAVTAPAQNRGIDKKDIRRNVYSEGNTAMYQAIEGEESDVVGEKIPITVVYIPSENSGGQSLPVIIRYFDSDGREIGSGQVVIAVTKIWDDTELLTKLYSFGISLEIKPNPANSRAVVTLDLRNDEVLSITLNDLQGNEVSRILSETMVFKGTHEYTINNDQLTSGTYFIVTKTNDNRVVRTQLKIVR